MDDESKGGSAWVFELTDAKGRGFWYRVGAGRFDEEGRAFGSVRKLPQRGGSGDVMICPPGVEPPGEKSPPSFPFLRYAAQIDSKGEPLGLIWCFRHIHKTGKGHPDDTGVSWFDEEGRARGRFLLRLTSGFKGIIIICPPGVEPPPGPYPPAVTLPTKPGERRDEDEEEDEETEI
jgi:hypothetical protein